MKISSKGKPLYLPLAKIYFIFSGYGIYFGLTRILSAEEFGSYGIVISFISIINMLFINGTLQATSKLVSETENPRGVLNLSLRIQSYIGGALLLLLWVLAAPIAAILRDPSLTNLIRIASFIMISYCFYACYVGVWNGLRDFRTQGLMEMFYSTLKIVFVLILASTSIRSAGAVFGFALAAFFTLSVAFFITRRKLHSAKAASEVDWKPLIFYQTAIITFFLILNVVMNTDLFLLKVLSDPNEASVNAGYYMAGLTLSRVPYMILVSLNFALFPLISKATHAQKEESTHYYIQKGLRLCIGFAFPVAVIFSCNAKDILPFVYPEEYISGATALSVLALGYAFFSLFLTSATIITSGGKPIHSIFLVLGVFVAQTILCFNLIPTHGLLGASLSSALSFFVGAAVCVFVVLKRHKTQLPWKSMLRILLASGALYVVGYLFQSSGIFLVVECFSLALLYVGILIGSQEISKQEIESVLAKVRGKLYAPKQKNSGDPSGL